MLPAVTDGEREEAADQSSGSDKTYSSINSLSDDFLHVYGDIIQVSVGSLLKQHLVDLQMQLLPSNPEIRRAPYVTLSGLASNKTDAFFDLNASQYTSFYKTQRRLSSFPIRAHFDDIRYKNKKPIPSNNTYVAVEGFLQWVDVNPDNGQPVLFHLNVDNINFLGKAVLPVSGSNEGPSHSSPFGVNANCIQQHLLQV